MLKNQITRVNSRKKYDHLACHTFVPPVCGKVWHPKKSYIYVIPVDKLRLRDIHHFKKKHSHTEKYISPAGILFLYFFIPTKK